MMWGKSAQPVLLRFLHRRTFSVATATATAPTWTPYRSATVRLLALNDLRDLPGAIKKRHRVGRGPGSGIGKTCGKGTKGTYQRHRLRKRGFEGGPTTLWKGTPKFGKKYQLRKYQSLCIYKLLMWVRMGRLDTSQPLTMKMLVDSNIMGRCGNIEGVKLMARSVDGFVDQYQKLGLPPPKLIVSDASEQAKAAIERVGGSVELRWMGRVPTRAHFHPEKFPILPASNGIPPRKKWGKYGFSFPEDRLYHGTEKRRTFPVRTPPKE